MNTTPQATPELNPELAIINGEIKTISLKIAEHFCKQHKTVLRAIQNLECSPEFNGRNFVLVEYEDAKGEKRPSYEITRDGFTFLAMGFTGKQAAQWKEAYILAFNRLESELQGKPEPKALDAAQLTKLIRNEISHALPMTGYLLPPEQAKEITQRLDRLGQLFHPFSAQFGDVLGIGRALRGLHPNLGIQEPSYRRVLELPADSKSQG